MIITKMENLSSSRTKIYSDEDIAFVLYKGELRLYGIKEGEELPEDVWQDIKDNVLKKRARLRCMNLLKERSYTENQLKQKLTAGGYPQEMVADAVEYVKSYGYVDDRRYAADYIENQSEKKSRRRIEEDLQRRGISRELIREALENSEECGYESELTLAKELLVKKHYSPDSTDYKERQKIAAYLYRKGIGMQTIRAAMLYEEEY